METKIIKEEKATITITVAAEKDAWKKAQEKAFQKIKSKLKLDGFRDGKSIPDALARPHIQDEQIFDSAINEIIEVMFKEGCEANKVVPFMQPDVKVNKVTTDELEIEFEIPLAPEVKLSNYKGHSVPLKEVKVDDEEVKHSVDELLKNNSNLKTVERPAKLGDTVVLDFDGYIGGVAFEGGSAKEYSLELGSNTFVPGFEEALVGVKAGDKKDVDVKFPEHYVKELAGKDATFKCVIKEVKEKEIPELNDEFAKSLGIENVSTVAELLENKKKELHDSKENTAKTEQFNELVKQIVNEAVVEVSDKMIQKEADAIKDNLKKQIEQNGLTFDQYVEITNTNIDKLDEDLKTQALQNIKTYSVLSKIGDVENITVSDKEVDDELANIGKQYGMSAEQVKQALGNRADSIKDNLKHKKIEDFIKANNNI